VSARRAGWCTATAVVTAIGRPGPGRSSCASPSSGGQLLSGLPGAATGGREGADGGDPGGVRAGHLDSPYDRPAAHGTASVGQCLYWIHRIRSPSTDRAVECDDSPRTLGPRHTVGRGRSMPLGSTAYGRPAPIELWSVRTRSSPRPAAHGRPRPARASIGSTAYGRPAPIELWDDSAPYDRPAAHGRPRSVSAWIGSTASIAQPPQPSTGTDRAMECDDPPVRSARGTHGPCPDWIHRIDRPASVELWNVMAAPYDRSAASDRARHPVGPSGRIG
jgi:hypothetical protein